jgi:hypothetical protein
LEKTFDSIAPERLLWALERFGLSPDMLLAIREIYTSRAFVVADAGHVSTEREQRAGISQGCPLSPFLFSMVMTVLMSDAVAELGPGAREAYQKAELEDVLFADDTLLISRVGEHLEEYMKAVEKHGKDYGLQVHWGKVHLMAVKSNQRLRAPNGSHLHPTASMVYLGSTVHEDGKFGCEVSRKIGAAGATFRSFCEVLRSTNLPMSQKLHIFDATVTQEHGCARPT